MENTWTVQVRQRDLTGKWELTGVADVEAFPSVGVVGLEFQPHDVTVGGDLWGNVFSREGPKSCRLWKAWETENMRWKLHPSLCLYDLGPRSHMTKKNTKKVIKSRQQYTKRSISLSIQTISRVFFHTFKPIKHHLWLSVNHYDRHKANHSSFVLRLNCAQANPAKWPEKFRLVFKAVSWQQLSKKIPARLQPQRKLDRLQHLCQTTKVDV